MALTGSSTVSCRRGFDRSWAGAKIPFLSDTGQEEGAHTDKRTQSQASLVPMGHTLKPTKPVWTFPNLALVEEKPSLRLSGPTESLPIDGAMSP